MIHSEKAILRSLTKLTKSTNDIIFCDVKDKRFYLTHGVNMFEKSVPFRERNIISMLRRLENCGYIKQAARRPGIDYFHLTLETIYRTQFTFDRFRHAFLCKFIYGLISGIIVGTASTIAAQYLLGLLLLP